MRVITHKSEIPPSQIFVIRHLKEKHFDPVWHAHSEYQLFVVLEGTGTRFVGDSIKPFKPGELVFTGPHLPHLWRSDENYFAKDSSLVTEGIVIYFNEHFLGNHIVDKEEMGAIRKLFTRANHGLEFYGADGEKITDMMRRLVDMKGVQSVIMLLDILDCMAASSNYAYISSKPSSGEVNKQESSRLNKVYEYVFKNFRRDISVVEVAAMLHMTPTSFSRYFASKNNRPFSKFVSEVRIKQACTLLTESEDPVAQICYECGFNTLSNFNRQFKEFMGKTPLEYKNEFLSI
jgi:AraC-like DNA-binding protein